ncbi:MAG: hypothetical protein Q9195_007468 [Heterodermia aff. obscurata]
MDSMPHQKETSKCGIMSIKIDANSRAPLHLPIPASRSPLSDITNGDDTRSFVTASDTLMTVTICSEAENQVSLSRSDKSLSDVSQERKTWNRSQRSKIHKLSTEFNTRVSKIRQKIIVEAQEARDTYLLLRSCRKCPLARKVRKGSEGKLRTTPQPASQPCSVPPPGPSPSETPTAPSTPLGSRKVSNSLLSLTSSSTTTLPSSPTTPLLPLRQRKISAPLEYNPAFHPRQLSQNLETLRHRSISSSSSMLPVFRTPSYTPPSTEDCTACEIVRVVPHDDIAEDEPVRSPRIKVLRRLSDERGNCFIEEVKDAGKKKVLLQWGKEVDAVIPPVEDFGDEGDGKGFRAWWRRVRGVRRDEEADLLWEMYP